MGLLDNLFGKKAPPPALQDPVFGQLTYGKHDGWENRSFTLWGYSGVQLLLDGDESGPTERQRQAFLHLRDAQSALMPKLTKAVEERQDELRSTRGGLSVSALSIPLLDDSKSGRLSTMWFVSTLDDHFQFGVQTTDNWAAFMAFADD